MRVTVTTRCPTGPHVPAYAERRLSRLARHCRELAEVHLVLDGDLGRVPRYRVGAVAHVGHTLLTAEVEGMTLREAVDGVVDKLDRQIVRRKERLSEHKGHAAAGADPASPGPRPWRGERR